MSILTLIAHNSIETLQFKKINSSIFSLDLDFILFLTKIAAV